jgi:5'-3' exonuclease
VSVINLLIDGSHLVRRIAHTDLGAVVTSKGYPSGLAHGFLNNLIYLSKVYAGNAKAYVVFDSGKSQYRLSVYSDYKCNRIDMSHKDYVGPDITLAKNYIQSVLQIAGIPCFMSYGIEADDLIAALSYQFPNNSVIISGDRDFFQLVTEGVVLFDPIKKITFNIDKIATDIYDRDNWKDQYIFHKCIIGDKDEVPQVIKGLGFNKALPLAKLLSYGCQLPNDKYGLIIRENLAIIDRNIELFDLQLAYDLLKDQLLTIIKSFEPATLRGVELERALYFVLSKWELDIISQNIIHLIALRSIVPIN